MSQNENLLDVVTLLYKWKTYILGAGFIAAVLTAGASLTLDNYYEASTLFYAASPDLSDPVPVGPTNHRKYIYGSGEDMDRLFSISKSNSLKNYLTEKFNLYDHYEIDRNAELARHKLNLKLNKLYTADKTKYDAIRLSVEDKDPDFAAAVANVARDKINELAQDVIKASFQKRLSAFQNVQAKKQDEYNLLIDSLMKVKQKYGIFSSDTQGEAYGSSLVKAEGEVLKAEGALSILRNTPGIEEDSIAKIQAKKLGYEKLLVKLKKDVANFNLGHPIVKYLERSTRDLGAQLTLSQLQISSLKEAYEADFAAIHIIEHAESPPYKSRPKRSILVIMVAGITSLLMCLWVLIRDQFKKMKS